MQFRTGRRIRAANRAKRPCVGCLLRRAFACPAVPQGGPRSLRWNGCRCAVFSDEALLQAGIGTSQEGLNMKQLAIALAFVGAGTVGLANTSHAMTLPAPSALKEAVPSNASQAFWRGGGWGP